MAKEFKFPDVGEGITEGEIVRWLVAEGDAIKEDQGLAEIETDKAVVEMPSPFAGKVLKLHFKPGDIVKVGQVLATIGAEGESAAIVPEAAAPAAAGGAPAPAREEVPAAAGAEIAATPKIRKLALELAVDLSRIRGTGPSGRITEEDVRAFRAEPEKKPTIRIKPKFDFYGEIDYIPLRGIRRATARRLTESIRKAVHVTHFDEADASALAEARRKMKGEAEAQGVPLTYLPFIVKAVVEALKLHPMLNATVDDENEEIVVRKYYNIGIAVDVPDGLIVPVVKAADQKTILEIAGDIRDLADAARKRTLDLADLKGGTFSITNVGAIGGDAATPIINYPEVAILATMRIGERARADKGSVRVKTVLPLCLSFDHRVVDGAEAARFTKDLIGFLENPAP
ncbi:MAG: dihydrolipoamide acetyltransferase family protein [Candidatus Aminicenantales bacterium]